jgi:hypothetical protein
MAVPSKPRRRLAVIAALAITCLAALPGTAVAFEFGDPVDLSGEGSNPRLNTVAVNAAGDTAAAWLDVSCGCIFVSRRPADAAWEAPVGLGLANQPTDLRAAIDPDGNLAVVWNGNAAPSAGNKIVRAAYLAADAGAPEPAADLYSLASWPGEVAGVGFDADGAATVAWTEQVTTTTSRIRSAVRSAGAGGTWSASSELLAPGSVRDAALHVNEAGAALLAYVTQASGQPAVVSARSRAGAGEPWDPAVQVAALGASETLQNFMGAAPLRVHVDGDGDETVVLALDRGETETVVEARRSATGAWQPPADVAASTAGSHPKLDAAFNTDGALLLVWEADNGDGTLVVRSLIRSGTGAWPSSPETATEPTEPFVVDHLDAVLDDNGQAHLLLAAAQAPVVPPQIRATTRPADGVWSATQTVAAGLDSATSWLIDDGVSAAADVAGRLTAVFKARPVGEDLRILAVTGDEDAGGGVVTDPGDDGAPAGTGAGSPVSPLLPAHAAPALPAPGGPAPGPAPGTDLRVVSTETLRAMPSVVRRRVDAARDAVERAGIRADFDLVETHRRVGKAGIGDVVAQFPRAGARLRSSVAEQPRVKLTVYAGPKPVSRKSRRACPIGTLDRELGKTDLDVAEDILDRQRVDVTYDVQITSGADEPEVRDIRREGRCAAEVDVRAPRRPADNDLYVTVREHPTGMSFGADDWALTAGERNAFTLQVVDKAGRLVRDAEVVVDNTGVGASPKYENLVKESDRNGEASFVAPLPRAGTVNVLVRAAGRNDVELWGTAQLRVANRARGASCLESVTGRAYRRGRDGWSSSSRSCGAASGARVRARAASSGNLFTWVLEQLFGRGPEKPVATAEARRGLRSLAADRRMFPAQLAFGSRIGDPTGKARVVNGAVTVVSAGSGNVVSAGGGNVISAGGGNAVVTAAAGVVSAGGGNVISAGGGNVVSAGGGNVVSAGGGNVISAGGGNVVSAGSGNAIAINNGSLIGGAGGNVVSAGGGNVVSAGGGN